ncbi:MAG: DLW-39 family protein [Bifidobacteriaceae bacterium]|nr:DLW-39 family protein [Bifidobacteriaceae bacterium]
MKKVLVALGLAALGFIVYRIISDKTASDDDLWNEVTDPVA